MSSQQHAGDAGAEVAMVGIQQPILSACDDWLSSHADDVRTVDAFCQAHDLHAAAKTAIGLVKKHFPSVRNLNLALSGDPESDGQWLVLEFDAAGGVEGVLDAYGKLKREWVSAAQGQATAPIRFLYNIH